MSPARLRLLSSARGVARLDAADLVHQALWAGLPSTGRRRAAARRGRPARHPGDRPRVSPHALHRGVRSEEHTSELQSPCNLVCRLLLEKKKNKKYRRIYNEVTAIVLHE